MNEKISSEKSFKDVYFCNPKIEANGPISNHCLKEKSTFSPPKINFDNFKNFLSPKINDEVFKQKIQTIPPIKTFEWTITKKIKSRFQGQLDQRIKLDISDEFTDKIQKQMNKLFEINSNNNLIGKRSFEGFEKSQNFPNTIPLNTANLNNENVQKNLFNAPQSTKDFKENSISTLLSDTSSVSDTFNFDNKTNKSTYSIIFFILNVKYII
jgi:hypothetical protein